MQAKRAARLLGLSVTEYKAETDLVRGILKETEGSKVRLAVSLYAFRAKLCGDVDKSFLRVCAQEFALDNSTVSRCLSVISTFGNGKKDALLPEYVDYSFSVLSEMLTLPEENRAMVKPCWTVKNVRDYKRLLEKDAKQAEEQIAEEEKPEDDYARFKKWTKAQLCKEILRLEKEINLLR